MKPKVLHLLDDKNVGGIKSSLQSLVRSRLAEQFDFEIQSVQEARLQNAEARADIVVLHNPRSWANLPDLLRIKCLVKKLLIQDHHYCQGFEGQVASIPRFHLMLKSAAKLADRIIAVSRAQGQWMLDNQLVSGAKLHVIQQCTVTEPFLAVPLKAATRPLTLAAYGRFAPQKGFDILLEAMRLIPDANVRLLIAGYGPDEARLKQLAEGLEVVFCGCIDSVPAFLEHCDVVIIPSRWEPWGNVCLEARAAGKPVVVSDVDGLSEQAGDCGVLVPPEDPQQLARVIASLEEHDLERWGKTGRASVQGSWDRCMSAWELLLWEEILT